MLTRRKLLKGVVAGVAAVFGLPAALKALPKPPISFKGVPLQFGEGKPYQKTVVVVDRLPFGDESTTYFFSRDHVWAYRRGQVLPVAFSRIDPGDWDFTDDEGAV